MINRTENVYSYMFTGLLVLQAIILLFWAVTMPVASVYEGELIFAAENMVRTGKWLWPETARNKVVYHTPVLPYWFSAAGHLLIPAGLSGFRIFHLLLYLSGLSGFLWLVKNYLNARTAFYTGCILTACLPFLWQMQLSTPDGPAAIFAVGALSGFYLRLKTNKKRYLWVLYGSLAAGMLSKGLLILVIPLLIMMVYLMFKIKMNETALNKLKAGKGVLLTLLIVLPWYAFAGFKDGGRWLSIFLNKFHWQQYVHGNTEAEGAFYLPYLFVLLMLLPLGVYFPRSFSYSWKYRVKKDFLLLAGLSILIILLFFAFSDTFYPHYLLPALPFCAVAIAYRFDAVSGRPLIKMGMTAEHFILALFALLIPAGCWYLLWMKSEGGPELNLYPIILVSILPLGTCITFFMWHKKQTEQGLMVLTFSSLLFFALLLYIASANPALWGWLSKVLY